MAKSRSNPEAFKFYGYFQRSSKMVRWIERNQILIFWRGRLFRLSESEGYSVVSDSLRPRGLHSPWNSPGQNTGVGSLSLLQGIFPTRGSNLGLSNCRQILYQLSHKGSPRILEWGAFHFSRGSSQPGDRTCIAGRFFTS